MSEQPRRPRHAGWRPDPDAAARVILRSMGRSVAEAWRYRGILVISAVEDVDDGRGATPTWHLSITERGDRPGLRAMATVRRDFDMEEAEEDNHGPAMKLRDLWLPIEPRMRGECACKAAEEPVIGVAGHGDDADVYVWRRGRT
jgi:hypothetical protein